MKKTLNRFIALIVISGVGYLGLKIYQLFKGLIELDKTLPSYLGNIIGDVPTVSITAVFNRITITVNYNKEIIKKNDGLENIVRDYVTDFYPIFKTDNVKVLIEELEKESVQEEQK